MINNGWKKRIILAAWSAAIVACGSQPTKDGSGGPTLADLDLSAKTPPKTTSITTLSKEPGATSTPPTTARSKEDVKNAYYDYINNAAKDDKLRLNAATRIAELELETATNNPDIAADEKKFEATVRKTIILLEDTLRDLPDAQGGDKTLYQLAKAYDQIGETEKAVGTLKTLVKKYPKTPFFVEAKFRIAENAFINGYFFDAEDAYTDVLKNEGSEVFYEKALFKRGWARYKQNLYPEALDDFYDALGRHGFGEVSKLNSGERELFDEYFRAIGLSFSYMGGPDAITGYFAGRADIPYVYRTYRTVAELLLSQQRYSDAAETYQAYVDTYPTQPDVVNAAMKTVSLWKNSGFFNSYVDAFERFYVNYNPDADYWKSPRASYTETDKKAAIAAIRSNLVLLAGHYHNAYLKQKKPAALSTAKLWYKRYLDGYKAYARQDKVYQLYAELLNKAGEYSDAFKYYELAAFDGDIVLDKESAYAAIYLSDRLIDASKAAASAGYLDKHLSYAQAYAQLYPNEKHSADIVQHAVGLAFKAKEFDRAVAIANTLPNDSSQAVRTQVTLLKAQSYFDLKQYEDAELVYIDLLASKQIPKNTVSDIKNKLALSIYKQAESSQSNGDTIEAARHFLRVYKEVPDSELAATGMYDAIALYMSNNQWDDAIYYLNVYKKQYPTSNQKDISQKLSVAYLKSNKGLEAAKEFETLKDFATTEEEKMAAQWQAGQLYLEKKDYESALRAFKEYAHTYKRPYAQNMEAMYIITDLYEKLSDPTKKAFWLRKIATADAKTTADNKTERTQYISSGAAFEMANLRFNDYKRIKLVHPLAKNLKAKKSVMQDVVKLFGQATVYGHEDFVTQSTFKIGELYRDFAKALLESERPKDLTDEQLEQYDILLEDQAFPFEDKSIEFYEANMGRIAGGLYDEWTKRSLAELKILYPARYNRKGRVETVYRHSAGGAQ